MRGLLIVWYYRSSGTFQPYISPTGFTGIGWLRSVYWDTTPVVNDLGQLIISANSLSKLLQDGKENSNDPTFSITEIGVVEGASQLKIEWM